MRIAYMNSRGETFELSDNRKIRIADADFHKYSYGYNGTEQIYGVELEEFKKSPCSYPVKLYFYGSASTRAEQIERLHDAAAYDRANKKHGKLIKGEWHIECYIMDGDTYPCDNIQNVTVKELTFLCPYPFWIREHNISLNTNSFEKETGSAGLDFPFDFGFDFTKNRYGNSIQEVSHYKPSNFKMKFFGPCTDPVIKINDYPYQIFTTLKRGEYLEIDSRHHTVTKYEENGKTSNLYNSRAFKHSVFEKIPSGILEFIWDGSFGIDLTLFLERSVPRWKSS